MYKWITAKCIIVRESVTIIHIKIVQDLKREHYLIKTRNQSEIQWISNPLKAFLNA